MDAGGLTLKKAFKTSRLDDFFAQEEARGVAGRAAAGPSRVTNGDSRTGFRLFPYRQPVLGDCGAQAEIPTARSEPSPARPYEPSSVPFVATTR